MGISESISQLRFISTKSLERGLDGSDEAFAAHYFAIYHCAPDEPAGINDYRNELRTRFPAKSTPVGKYFVLGGEPASSRCPVTTWQDRSPLEMKSVTICANA
jgi:hypothetical protein